MRVKCTEGVGRDKKTQKYIICVNKTFLVTCKRALKYVYPTSMHARRFLISDNEVASNRGASQNLNGKNFWSVSHVNEFLFSLKHAPRSNRPDAKNKIKENKKNTFRASSKSFWIMSFSLFSTFFFICESHKNFLIKRGLEERQTFHKNGIGSRVAQRNKKTILKVC